MQPNRRISGALFENQKGGPAFTGVIEIDGVKHHIALWPKKSAKGNDYLQVSEDKKKAQAAAGQGAVPQPVSPFKPRTPQRNNDMDDDIPF